MLGLNLKSRINALEKGFRNKAHSRIASDSVLYSFANARSLLFSAESLLGPLIEFSLNGKRPNLPTDDKKIFEAARVAMQKLLKKDIENIKRGLYPLDVLKTESPLRHLLRMPKMLIEGIEIARRRKAKANEQFSSEALDLLSDESVPDYYKRNFHFQGDGYMSNDSADLYEHQVEVLFAGCADSMRRQIIEPMKDHFRKLNAPADGEGLRFLEVGAGTGRATRFIRLAFPKAKIVAVDLSSPYLKRAQAQLKSFPHHDFVEADGAKLPFLEETFDAVYSVFLFHELPMPERKKVIAEGLRVLRGGGFYGFVDSLQRGDVPIFDTALERFPIDFHEPFYKNYSVHPMEEIFAAQGLQDIKTDTAFFAKIVSARKK